MTSTLAASRHDAGLDGIAELCRQALVSLRRSDQRRWGEIYVRGLVTVPGRKTIQKISEIVAGSAADQSLQQFVNQSPWEWGPVRYELAQVLSLSLPVRAWLVDEVAFPKNGHNSVGVTSQYVPAAARRMNCQLAVALSLAGDGFSCPVNWRLMLPRCWDDDPDRRRKSHLPADERHRPAWHHLLHVIDEAVDGWGLTPPAVVLDRRHDPAVEPLLRGLEDRRLRYVVRIPADTQVRTPGGGRAAGTVRAADLVRLSAYDRVMLPVPARAGERGPGSHVVSVPVPEGGPEDGPMRASRNGRRVVVQRRRGREQPCGTWATNLGATRLPEMVALAGMQNRARADAADLEHGSGLQHFEGRSYRGWHHHVTLASVAHASRLLAAGREGSTRIRADVWDVS